MNKKIYLTLLQILLLLLVIGGAWLLFNKGFGKLQPKPQASPAPVRFEPKTLRKEAYQIKRELTKTDKTSGDLILADNSDFQIVYLISNDQFIVDLKNLSFQEGKKRAEEWFRNKGFLQEELCVLRISFAASKAVESDFSFQDTFPTGCPVPTLKPQ